MSRKTMFTLSYAARALGAACLMGVSATMAEEPATKPFDPFAADGPSKEDTQKFIIDNLVKGGCQRDCPKYSYWFEGEGNCTFHKQYDDGVVSHYTIPMSAVDPTRPLDVEHRFNSGGVSGSSAVFVFVSSECRSDSERSEPRRGAICPTATTTALAHDAERLDRAFRRVAALCGAKAAPF